MHATSPLSPDYGQTCRWITSFLDFHVVDVSTLCLETFLQNQTFFDTTDAILSLLLVLSNASPILTCILETEDFIRSFTHSTVCLMAMSQSSSLQPIATTILTCFWKPTGVGIHPAMAVILHEMPSQRIVASLQGVVHQIQELSITPSSLRNFAYTIHFFCGSAISYLVSRRNYANYLLPRLIETSRRHSLPLWSTLSRAAHRTVHGVVPYKWSFECVRLRSVFRITVTENRTIR
ncbi:uncharacterized protein BT62DRAFT_1006660 [Guyanagaster necrorhizus]|uniref:Uncharacterized protein n=1 Tax=Guyanagaster necrorhizus TaxID=856835 RepID=A0A9P7VTG4_9AGAR|nr:uncharacterized protein BT62DRAFT_1006660 [Guyanagaster necrorhizus MCA 3950]KAG7445631.1 hypothetical protein BT62DRAFT_1006660 [Guyanagaster necrorhizus MCA 3950]